jgi:hypothetical protein
MAAKSNAVKKAEKLAKDKAQGVRNLTLPALPATLAHIDALLARYHVEDWRELVTLLLKAVHDGAFPDVLPVPRHEYKPSEKVLKRLVAAGILQARQEDVNDEH